MPGDVYRKTLADLRGATIVWSLGLAGLAAVNVLLFPTIQAMPDLVQFLEHLPPAFKAMIGDVGDMVRLEGFLRVKLFEPLPLLLAIFSVSQGAALIAGEVEHRSVDLLLSRPVRRSRVLLEKALALATATVVITAALTLGLLASVPRVAGEVDARALVLSAANALPLTWVFGAAALLGSCALLRSRGASLIAGGLVVASYVFETLRVLSPPLRGWEPVSLFAHAKAGVSMAGQVSPGPILLLLGLAAALTAAAALVFARRDLAA